MTAFTLIALQVVLSTPLAGLLGAATLPAKWAREWMDPAVPLIPPRTPATAPGGGSTVNTKLPPGSQGNNNPGVSAKKG